MLWEHGKAKFFLSLNKCILFFYKYNYSAYEIVILSEDCLGQLLDESYGHEGELTEQKGSQLILIQLLIMMMMMIIHYKMKHPG